MQVGGNGTGWQYAHSTISEKIYFLSRERTITRKANEALMSLVLDWRYDKNRILETYLNEIYLGQMAIRKFTVLN